MVDTVRVRNSIVESERISIAFTRFASSKAGQKFIGKYAANGQTIGGVTCKKDGKCSKKGIDLNYSAESFGKSKGGETTTTVGNDGRGQINVRINKNFYEIGTKNESMESMGKIGSLFHESFIHAELRAGDFLDNNQFDYSNISKNVKDAAANMEWHYHHYKVLLDFMDKGYNNGNLWPLEAYNGLKEINIQTKDYPNDQAIVSDMWYYNVGIQIDEK